MSAAVGIQGKMIVKIVMLPFLSEGLVKAIRSLQEILINDSLSKEKAA